MNSIFIISWVALLSPDKNIRQAQGGMDEHN